MWTSFQFHDAVQLNILLTLSSEILLLNWAQKKGGGPYETMIETLTGNSTKFFRLTLSQYGKAFALSATPVA